MHLLNTRERAERIPNVLVHSSLRLTEWYMPLSSYSQISYWDLLHVNFPV